MAVCQGLNFLFLRFFGRVFLKVSPLVAFGASGYRTKQSADA
jgi:hypothetical protein